MAHTILVSTEELYNHLNDPDWVIIDCRFDLTNPKWGWQVYQNSHIPGAAYAHLDHDLSAPITPASGRHPLPDPEAFIARASAWGIDERKQVVVYDSAGGAYAARLWWLLHYYGHEAAAVLDGGFTIWTAEYRPTSPGNEIHPPAKFHGQPHEGFLVTADDVDRLRNDPKYRIIDARSPVRYRGEMEPIDPVAGHIPGAVNRFHVDNLAPNTTLLPPETLRAQFLKLLDGVDPRNAIVYCGSGVTSCHHLLAMEYAGLPSGLLYAGSWSEWIRDPKRPVKKGGQP